MSRNDAFFDTNVLLYALSKNEPDKADRSAELIRTGGTISVQVLNEFSVVLRRKYRTEWSIVRRALQYLRESLDVVPLTIDVHLRGIEISERYQLGVYDSMIVAAALSIGSRTLWSEDMHDGLAIDGLTISNPFVTK